MRTSTKKHLIGVLKTLDIGIGKYANLCLRKVNGQIKLPFAAVKAPKPQTRKIKLKFCSNRNANKFLWNICLEKIFQLPNLSFDRSMALIKTKPLHKPTCFSKKCQRLFLRIHMFLPMKSFFKTTLGSWSFFIHNIFVYKDWLQLELKKITYLNVNIISLIFKPIFQWNSVKKGADLWLG